MCAHCGVTHNKPTPTLYKDATILLNCCPSSRAVVCLFVFYWALGEATAGTRFDAGQ